MCTTPAIYKPHSRAKKTSLALHESTPLRGTRRCCLVHSFVRLFARCGIVWPVWKSNDACRDPRFPDSVMAWSQGSGAFEPLPRLISRARIRASLAGGQLWQVARGMTSATCFKKGATRTSRPAILLNSSGARFGMLGSTGVTKRAMYGLFREMQLRGRVSGASCDGLRK